MNPKIAELVNSVQLAQTGKKRKLATENQFEAAAYRLLDDYNAYQQPPYQQQLQQQ